MCDKISEIAIQTFFMVSFMLYYYWGDGMDYDKIVAMWQNQDIKTVADLNQALDNYKIVFAYNSNKIEGSSVTIHQTREIFNNGKVINFSGDLRELYEVQNQKNCYEWLCEKIIDKVEITSAFILNMHKILLAGCYDENRWAKGERPGEYKKGFYITGDNVGLPPEEIEDELDNICRQINSVQVQDTEKILTAAAFLHCNFENMHPFADGNGRVGRTLMNYYLMIHNLPPTVIFDENKETYYLALTVFDKAEKLSGFIEFIKEQTIKTWKKGNTNLSRQLVL